MNRYDDPVIRQRAVYLRTGRNKGIRAALRESRRLAADVRNTLTPPERRRQARRLREEEAAS